jgi:serine/threonine protein phosphatase 1
MVVRYLAVGDIHGCFRALAALAEFVPFRPDDLLITLGDYVSRGPDSCAVLDWLCAYQKQGTLIALRGNHEVMMLESRDSPAVLQGWLECGGAAALASYSPFEGEPGALVDVPDEHWRFLEQTRRWHEIDSHFFVHANALPDADLADQPDYMLFWEFFESPPPHRSGKIMVCGHTNQRGGRPTDLGHAVCIDTGAHSRGWLTCLDVKSGQYWQANQMGQTRAGWLDEV